MKVLYFPLIYQEKIHSDQVGDYQCDTLFHGLRSILGDQIIDAYRMWHVYEDADPEKLKNTWGKGFSSYGILPNIEIPRDEHGYYDDLVSRIENRYFNFIICPIHHTLNGRYDDVNHALMSLLRTYEPHRIILVDGWDKFDLSRHVAKKVPYFKMQFADEDADVATPISFSIPKEKIREPSEKSFDFAPLVPAYMHFDDPHQKSYIYEDEDSYYQDYQKSYFAYVCKKAREDDERAGWVTMRHFEILANGCVPFFTDVEKCPKNALFNYPKELCVRAKKLKGVYPGTKEPYNPQEDTFIGTSKQILPGEDRGYIDFDEFDLNEYNSLRDEFIEYTRLHLTTESMAKYFFDKVLDYGVRNR